MDFPTNHHEEFVEATTKYMQDFTNDPANPTAMFFMMYNLDEENTAFRHIHHGSIEDNIVLLYMAAKQSHILGEVIKIVASRLRRDEGDEYLNNLTNDENI
jgi:hypothetical protein